MQRCWQDGNIYEFQVQAELVLPDMLVDLKRFARALSA
jgi:hypothetical protein